ncbi:MAG TPA: phospholipid carrier-dependent glycosyltransferase [Burkholderiaceae bacterium]|nr:phospholipid carrier-dependent glycosyltransferase [Burkholderiaceae bacterium]
MSSAAAEPSAPLRRLARGPTSRWLLALLAVVLSVRLITLGTYPLTDTSEARYAEIARVMRQTGNWVTPQETPGTPFWAKPPLYAWLSVASTYVLGTNEFALRLPSLLCGFAVLLLCGLWAAALARRSSPLPPPSPPAPLPQAGEGSHSAALSSQIGERSLETPDRPSPAQRERGGGEGQTALLSCLILSTTGFFIAYGAVMTDPALGFCTAWMMVAFQRAVIDGSGRAIWRYGFFVAGGLAMLAKGPVAFLYVALPIAIWAFWRRRWRLIWQALPWAGGILLAAAIALPWYLWAERRTPGFLNYFLVGEHLMRFLQPGWSGDRYGNAHQEPIGTVWAYLAAALGLWSVAALALAPPLRSWQARALAWCRDDARLFALLAALAPLLVITFARNLIWTYVLPALPPLAALLALELAQRSAQPGQWRRGVRLIAFASVAAVWVGATLWAPQRANGSSFAGPVAAWREQAAARPGVLLYWGARTPASLRFYSRGAAEPVPDLAARLAQLQPGARAYIAVAPEQLPALHELAASEPHALQMAVVARVKHAAIVEMGRDLSAR